MIASSKLLSDDNFYHFVRELAVQLQLVDHIELLHKLIHLNLKRIGLVAQSIITNYTRSKNIYKQMLLVRRIGGLLGEREEE